MSAISIEQAAQYDRDAGFSGPDLVTAVAIEMAESGLDPQARNGPGDNTPPSIDRGIWQINGYWHSEVSDGCAFDPACASKAAYAIYHDAGNRFTPWSTFQNGAYRAHVGAVEAALASAPQSPDPGGSKLSIGWWTISMRPWNSLHSIDEFGAGTLDGNPAHGGSNDACGPSTIEMAAAAYEGRDPTYANIGHIRYDMIVNGQWTAGGSVGNPRTGGCFLQNIAWEIPRRRYAVLDHQYDENGALSNAQQIHDTLRHHSAVIYNVTKAFVLPGNEQGVNDHFVVAVGYGGDSGTIQNAPSGYFDEHGYGKVYILNSDIAGQHGVATGQWVWIDELVNAAVVGFDVMGQQSTPSAPPPSPAPVPQPPVAVNWKKISSDLSSLADEINAAITQEETESNG